MITVAYPHDQVTINRIHHLLTTRISSAPSCCHRCGTKGILPAETVDPLKRMQSSASLKDTYVQWAEGEVLRFGYLSLYHLWERQVISLIEDQLARRGRTFERTGEAL